MSFWRSVDNAEPYYAAVEGSLFFLILCVTSSRDHYTWWNLFIVMIYDLGLALSLKRPDFIRVKRYWLAVLLSAITVVCGVIVMSALSCKLLSNIYHEEGPFTYTAGNFVVHYLPMCHLALWPNFRDWSAIHVQEMAGLAAGPLVLYALVFNPNVIYQCTKTSHALSTFILVLLPTFTFMGGLFIDIFQEAESKSSQSRRVLQTKIIKQ